MPPQLMTLGQSWMVEVLRWIARHAEPFHYAARAEIGRYGKRHDLSKTQLFKAEPENRPSTLCGISTAPVLRSETPSNLNAGSKVRLETGDRQPNESRERRDACDLYGP